MNQPKPAPQLAPLDYDGAQRQIDGIVRQFGVKLALTMIADFAHRIATAKTFRHARDAGELEKAGQWQRGAVRITMCASSDDIRPLTTNGD